MTETPRTFATPLGTARQPERRSAASVPVPARFHFWRPFDARAAHDQWRQA